MVTRATALVTGGTGYVAGWCIVTLLERGYDVRTTVRAPDKAASIRAAVSTAIDPGDRLAFAEADLTADAGWADAVAGCDYVLHIASPLGDSPDADDLIIPARDGTLRVLRAAVAAGVQRVVMTSAANAASPASYAEDSVTDETLWTDADDATMPAYRRAKTLAERAAWNFMAASGGPTTLATVLPGAVFGPILARDTIGSSQLIARMLRGEMPGLPRIGLEVVDVRDIADLHIRAMTAGEAGGERFLGTGEFMWMADVASVLREGLGDAATRVPTDEVPDDVIRELAAASAELRGILPGLGRRNRHTTAKAETVLGWTRRPAADAILDCGRSLIARGAIS